MSQPYGKLPKRTILQQAVREIEKSVSGALFLLFVAETTEQKVALRSIFVAAVCYQAQRQLAVIPSQLQRDLTESQLSFYRRLEENPKGDLAVWIVAQYSAFGRLRPDEESLWAKDLATWLYLAQRYLEHRVKGESGPPEVDWGRRESALRERLRQMGSPPATVVDLEGGKLRFLRDGAEVGTAELEVIGVYFPEQKAYQAGWVLPWIPRKSRPVPALGCASQLFRVEPHQVLSKVHRSAAVLACEYHLVQNEPDRSLHLGLRNIQETGHQVTFEVQDVRNEVLAKVRKFEQFASTQEPRRVVELLTAQIQELERRQTLFSPTSPGYELLSQTVKAMEELKQGLRVDTFLGLKKSSLSREESRQVGKVAEELRTKWV